MATKYCANCGAPLTPDSRFCDACGTPVTAAQPPVQSAPPPPRPAYSPPPPPMTPPPTRMAPGAGQAYCAACGSANAAGAGFCNVCGTRLALPAGQPVQYIPPAQHVQPVQYQRPAPVQPAYTMDQVSCPSCGSPNVAGTAFCFNCGAPLGGGPAAQAVPRYQAAPANQGISSKSKTTLAVLAFFLGSLGIHRFYAGKTGSGVVMLVLLIIGAILNSLLGIIGLLVLSALGLWVFIDWIMALTGKFTDKEGKRIAK